MLGFLKRQINHCQSKHHLCKVASGIYEITAKEWLVGWAGCVVVPEGVHPHEVGILLGDSKLIIIILSPLLGGGQLAE